MATVALAPSGVPQAHPRVDCKASVKRRPRRTGAEWQAQTAYKDVTRAVD